ncbi:MFS transporter [Curtobacterium sp. C1]|uniref:MFS transporter n=1 Tax=Curtobacterium TaxID=2034 RepID=UPI001E3D52A4|nr:MULTISPECIES: MFS transporter [Curtobacterium]MCS5485985.1 MFS transporter [Curtobacterium flaccumfaciens pv. basellae]MDK8171530.1 MFS transporter [Curtobacterium citreum]UFU14302.1 MFS transporter [Curtobacterium sp. C1]
MLQPRRTDASLVSLAGRWYFPIAFVARLPFAMMVVGVLTLVVASRDSVALGGVNSAFVGIGSAVFGPLVGAAADRFGQRAVLVPVGLANAVLLGALPFVVAGTAPDLAVLAMSFCIGASAPQVAPMSRTRLVAIIRQRMAPQRHERVLSGTMAYESAADETVFIVGPFLVGLLASAIAPWVAVAGAAALTLVFVTAFALHPTGRLVVGGAERETPAPATQLLRPRLVVVVLGILGVGLFFGSTLTSLTAFMEQHGESSQAGLLYGIMGIGSAALALGSAAFPRAFGVGWRWLAFGVVLLAGAVAFAAADSVGAVALVLGLMGIGIGPTLVAQYSLGSERSPVGRSATTMTILGSAVIVGQSVASAIVGEVAERAGTGAAMAFPAYAAALVVLAAVLNLVLARRAA